MLETPAPRHGYFCVAGEQSLLHSACSGSLLTFLQKILDGMLGLGRDWSAFFLLSPFPTFPSRQGLLQGLVRTKLPHLPFSLSTPSPIGTPPGHHHLPPTWEIQSTENLRNLVELSFTCGETEPGGEVTHLAPKRQSRILDARLFLCFSVPHPHPILVPILFPVPGFLLCLLLMALGIFKARLWPHNMWKGWRLLPRNPVLGGPDVTSPDGALSAPAVPSRGTCSPFWHHLPGTGSLPFHMPQGRGVLSCSSCLLGIASPA